VIERRFYYTPDNDQNTSIFRGRGVFQKSEFYWRSNFTQVLLQNLGFFVERFFSAGVYKTGKIIYNNYKEEGMSILEGVIFDIQEQGGL
jgi:hypothetical protein